MTEQNNLMSKIELQFSINEILPLMATAYAKEAAAPIIKAATSSSKGMLKKYKINSERLEDTYFTHLSETVISKLEEIFESELKTRFKEENSITLIFYNHTLSVSLGDIVVSTDDFRILFNVLFVEKLNTSINLNNEYCVDFENSTFLHRIAAGIIEQIDMYQIVQYVQKENG